jgi:hypothetical protein
MGSFIRYEENEMLQIQLVLGLLLAIITIIKLFCK